MKLWKVIVWAAVMTVVACGRDDIVPEQYQHKPTENNQGQEQEKEQEKEEEKDPVDTTPVRLYGNIIGTGRWSGLDLYDAHVITKITFSPKASQGKKLELGLFEGANKADFSDALPLYMIKAPVTDGTLVSVEINCSRGFRYVRYKSPSSSLYNLASMEFYGYKDTGDDSQFYQITNLPTVVINTEGGQNVTSKTTYINSTVYIISQDGKDLLTGLETGIRGRGNASWSFPKKPYKLKFAEKQSPLGDYGLDNHFTLRRMTMREYGYLYSPISCSSMFMRDAFLVLDRIHRIDRIAHGGRGTEYSPSRLRRQPPLGGGMLIVRQPAMSIAIPPPRGGWPVGPGEVLRIWIITSPSGG